MSAALQHSDPWAVVHEEASHPAAPANPASHEHAARDAEMWGKTATAAAQLAGQHAERIQALTDATVQSVHNAAAMVEEMRRISDFNREMVAAFGVMAQGLQTVVAELRKPRRMTVTKRDRNGAVAEAVSEVG